MTHCTATLTTATVTPCPDPANGCDADECRGSIGNPRHVELHTLTCVRHIDHTTQHSDSKHIQPGAAYWSNDTPGATPHTPTSTVTDAEVEAALDVLVRNGQPVYNSTVVSLREALEAAAAVRAAREGGR